MVPAETHSRVVHFPDRDSGGPNSDAGDPRDPAGAHYDPAGDPAGSTPAGDRLIVPTRNHDWGYRGNVSSIATWLRNG